MKVTAYALQQSSRFGNVIAGKKQAKYAPINSALTQAGDKLIGGKTDKEKPVMVRKNVVYPRFQRRGDGGRRKESE